MDRAFLTIKWGTEFDPDDVNILMRAAMAHTSVRARFICLTDNADGLDPYIEVFPIPAFDIYRDAPKVGIWPKISLFHPDIADVADVVVFLDIDTLVLGPLDDFFEDPGQTLRLLSCGQRWVQMDDTLDPEAATGVMAYRPAFQTHIFERFLTDMERFTSEFVVEQLFVGYAAKAITYFPVPWIESFKYHLRQPYLVDLFRSPRLPKPTTKLLAFHGFPRPRYVADRNMRWARPPRAGFHRPEWIAEYFRAYSGGFRED